MTTLPQTTPMRLPRSTNQGQVMVPSQLGIQHPASSAIGQNSPLTPADAWRVIRTNMWLIGGTVIVSLMIGLGVNFYLARYYAAYTAIGFLRVQTGYELVGTNEPAPQSVELEQRTQAGMLTHDFLWSKVLRTDDKIRQTSWFQKFTSPQGARKDLEAHLDVQVIPNSRLIRVAMQNQVPADSKTIVEEIAGQHIRDQRSVAIDNFVNKSAPLKNMIDSYEQDLRSIITKIREKSKNAGVDGQAVPQMEIQQLLNERVTIETKRSDAVQFLQDLNATLARGEDPQGMLDALARSESYADVQRAKSNLDAQMRTMIDQYGQDHPKTRNLRRQYDGYAGQAADIKEEIKAGLVAELRNFNQSIVNSTTKALEGIDTRREAAEAEMQKIQALRSEIASLEAEERLKREAVEKARAEKEGLAAQVLVGNQSNVEWASLPQIPEEPSFPKLWMSLAISGMLGLMLSVGIAFLREVTDTSVRSPRDIARVGQINLLGMITHQDDDAQSAGARLPLVIFDAPQSVIAEQFRQVRTRLQHAASLDTVRSLLITGASAGDGKTTAACNLAAGLALNGRKILLVDANFRRPELNNVFEMDNETGFSDVLGSLDRFEDCIRETHVPNLCVLTSGPRPSNATELLESQLLIDFIERTLEEFDHVIFDSGPLPLVSETVALAPRVDGVVTVVKAQANSRGLVQRVRDQLRQVKAEHLGMILNAVRAQVGGYYGRNILDYYKYQNTK